MIKQAEKKHVFTIGRKNTDKTAKPGRAGKKINCGECQASCQSACKTSCTVANQLCENK
ncbi:MAG: six-cysteine ranthipeptide SCIFF [Oscillospiraceae bacterium]|nr:six-cysteine ranthipeptide SCIFF [Oscillospiraceae bacterium]